MFCVSIVFRSLRHIEMVRHIACALMQQAEGEDQCDSIPAHVLNYREKNVRNTLRDLFESDWK